MAPDLPALLAGRRGHFQMESGYHSELWLNLERLFDDPGRLQPFISILALPLSTHRLDAVCGPMTGGAQLAALIGAQLGIPHFQTERMADPSPTGLFPVSYRVAATDRVKLHGKRVGIVDDAISAGSAVKGTFRDLLACGAIPVACGALLILGKSADDFAAQNRLALAGVARMPFNMWKPEECPLCRAGVPIDLVAGS